MLLTFCQWKVDLKLLNVFRLEAFSKNTILQSGREKGEEGVLESDKLQL